MNASGPISLARRQFVVTDRKGGMTELYCKNCGTQIAGVMYTKKFPGGKFTRMKNFAEMKMRFDDNSFHITVLCTGCIDAVAGNKLRMQAMYDADIEAMNMSDELADVYAHRKNPKCVKVDKTQQGLE